jgi:acyl-coenzyme A thioesterase PaaI-like protein
LHLEFAPYGEKGLQSEYTPAQVYQGYKDVVHGGILGLLLDEVIVNLPWKRQRIVAVTAELTLRLHRPARIGQKLRITAVPDGEPRGRLIPIQGEIRLADGTLVASAKAKCIKVPGIPPDEPI